MTTSDENSDILTFMPLLVLKKSFQKNKAYYRGSGQEVGRSCHFMQFKGKKIMVT
jgi:hypothetical protein